MVLLPVLVAYACLSLWEDEGKSPLEPLITVTVTHVLPLDSPRGVGRLCLFIRPICYER